METNISIEIEEKTSVESKTSYRQIMKATTLFGGVQVFGILISIIRSKVVAILLGTTGMGVIGLYQSTLGLVQSITGMGLSTSAVRDISEANGTSDTKRIASAVKTLRHWVWATGLFGSITILSLAPFLSKWTFGNDDYTWAFIWLSVILFINAIDSGQTVLLQGMRRLKHLAMASLYGSVLGLFTSLPLYYFFGLQGIIPALIITALSTLGLDFYFAKKIPIEPIPQSLKHSYHAGMGMAKLGFVMMLSGFMLTLSSYIIYIFISNQGGVSEVGLYRAGWTITTQYTGLIFTAMGTDYFPRLAAINTDNAKLRTAVNQQAEIAILILGPMLIALIGFIPLIVQLLYTSEFMPITGMIKWTMLGMLFKAASWAMAFTIVAKGDNRLFIITETIGNILMIILNVVFYILFGLNGIGISFAVNYLVYFLLVYLLVRNKYEISYHPIFWRILLIQNLFVLTAFTLSLIPSSILTYILAGLLMIAAGIYSLKELNRRLDLRKYINKGNDYANRSN